jgi:hypothetical protein
MQVVDAIYAVIKQQPYNKEMWQFNITAKDDSVTKKKVVKIIGWSAYRSDIESIVKAAAVGCEYNLTDFVAVRDALPTPFRISCGPGTAPCGDICIPYGDYCKLTQLEARPPTTPVSSPTGSPTPAPTTKTNSNTKAP